MSEQTSTEKWQGAGYARHSGHHRAADEWFLGRHRPAATDVVVDVGCGSGEFTALLAAQVPDGRVVGVDRDPSMLAQARRHESENLRFVQASADEVDRVVDPGSVDLVVSRAMLHWLSPDVRRRYFSAANRVLRPGGVLHTEGAGTGNVPRVTELIEDLAARHGLPTPPSFPDTGTVLEELEVAGFEVPEGGVSTVAQRRRFDVAGMEGFLRTQVVLVLTRHASADVAAAIEREVLASLDRLRRHDGSLDQTFVRLDLLVRRPASD